MSAFGVKFDGTPFPWPSMRLDQAFDPHLVRLAAEQYGSTS